MGVCGLSWMGFVVQTSGLGIARGTVQGREGSVGPGSFCWGSRRVLVAADGEVLVLRSKATLLRAPCLSPSLLLVHCPGQMLSFGPW